MILSGTVASEPSAESRVRAPRSRRSRRRAFLFVVSLFLALAACEIALRIAERLWAGQTSLVAATFRIPDQRTHHALLPFISSHEAWQGRDIAITTNSLGMRDSSPRIVPKNDSTKYRVLLLGDSFVEGVGVAAEATVASKLEELLNRMHGSRDGGAARSIGHPHPVDNTRSRPVEVLNGGVVSYSPLLERLRLEQLLSNGLVLDRVVLFIDPSDVQDEIVYAREMNAPLETATSGATAFQGGLQLFGYRTSALYRLGWRALQSSRRNHGWRSNYHRDRERWTEDDELIRLWGEQGMKLLFDNVSDVAQLCDANGIRFGVVIYPWPCQIMSDRRTCVIEAAAEACCREHEVPLLNLYGRFRARPDWGDLFLPNDVHWNEKGHRFVAEAVAAWLCEGNRSGL